MGSQTPGSTSVTRTQRFSYRRTGMKTYSALLSAAWALGFILWPISARGGEGRHFALIFGLPGFLFLFLLSANFCLMTSDVEVSPNSISWLLFGWRWKEIRWVDLSHIRVAPFWDFERGRRTKAYYLYRDKKLRPYFFPRGGMSVSENISDAQELENILKCQIVKWKIPVEYHESK